MENKLKLKCCMYDVQGIVIDAAGAVCYWYLQFYSDYINVFLAISSCSSFGDQKNFN